jgi:hypothetical protein
MAAWTVRASQKLWAILCREPGGNKSALKSEVGSWMLAEGHFTIASRNSPLFLIYYIK